jgi:hypothetical protein
VPPTAASSTELAPSGWTLVGVPASEPLYPEWTQFRTVSDGLGQVWLLGPWQLVRLDPESGDATVWDAADDLQFASTDMTLAGAAGAGVWLLDGSRVRLFDGQRFAIDLRVPDEVVNVEGGPESQGWVTDLVQVGSEVWVSVVDASDGEDGQGACCFPHQGSGGRVARYVEGRWEPMSEPSDGVGGYLAVDIDGAVWAGGVVAPLRSQSLMMGGVRRWDGQAWSMPAGEDEDAPSQPGAVAADRTGGVWFVSGADGLRHFDGEHWRTPAPDPANAIDESWTPGGRKLAVESDGTAWAVTAGLVQAPPDGPLRGYGPEAGMSGAGGLAVGSADTLVVADYPTVLRHEGDRFAPIWTGAPTVGWPYQGLVMRAVSADELWVNALDTWYRSSQGNWEELGPGLSCCTVASDGALWTTVPDEAMAYPGGGQLVRIDAAGSRPVPGEAVFSGYGATVDAGPDGTVWALQDDGVVQVLPDGTRRPIGVPTSVDAPPEDYGPEYADRVCLHGVDPGGAVWVSEFSDADDEECTAGTWHRWDGGRWDAAEAPDPFTSSPEHLVTGEGAGWVLRPSNAGTEISRLVDGALVPVAERPSLRQLAAAVGGGACAFEYASRDDIEPLTIVCFGPEGEEYARIDVAGMATYDSHFSIAADGSVWLLGPQVAKLGQPLPTP